MVPFTLRAMPSRFVEPTNWSGMSCTVPKNRLIQHENVTSCRPVKSTAKTSSFKLKAPFMTELSIRTWQLPS